MDSSSIIQYSKRSSGTGSLMEYKASVMFIIQYELQLQRRYYLIFPELKYNKHKTVSQNVILKWIFFRW
jgi:hypothetical protein